MKTTTFLSGKGEMSMSINTKPITEVPVIEELSEGDKLLVNSGGAAKQIDASKVGGSGGGGGGIIYCMPMGGTEESLNVSCHKSASRNETDIMTFVEFAGLVSSGPVSLAISEDGVLELYLTPMMIMPNHETSTAMGMFLMNGDVVIMNLLFPDSAGLD
jgi:hypothetical protein